jgi:hypothetical protein
VLVVLGSDLHDDELGVLEVHTAVRVCAQV